ncbi:MAG: exodeoxyribonuclease VII small subunit [Rhodobacteraceae bacterium]|uniref:exodeoxyribonuclease VII small subunit n=1 Tax=Amaricoccus sp. B4 TaxID=3368557 RepID=UPI000DAD3F36|nr:exodeoxyribonuclease VII small subunit [Paracoccaceae bacterium]
MAESAAPVATLSFEDALAELESVVTALEKGTVPLEESITLYERGAELRRHCEGKLRDAEAKVTQITQGADGSVGGRDVDIS